MLAFLIMGLVAQSSPELDRGYFPVAVDLRYGRQAPAHDLVDPESQKVLTPMEVILWEQQRGSSAHFDPAPSRIWAPYQSNQKPSDEPKEPFQFYHFESLEIPHYFAFLILDSRQKLWRVWLSRFNHAAIVRACF